MKTKIIYLLTIIITSLFVIGCSSEKNEKKECPLDIEGVFCVNSEIFSISEDSYNLVKKDGRLRLKVKLLLNETSDLGVDIYPKVILKDIDGMEIVEDWNQMELSDSEKQKFDKFIKGELGNEVEFLFINEFSSNLFDEVLSSSNKFAITTFRLNELKTNEDSDKEFDDAMEDLDKIMELTGKTLDLTKDAVKTAEKLQK